MNDFAVHDNYMYTCVSGGVHVRDMKGEVLDYEFLYDAKNIFVCGDTVVLSTYERDIVVFSMEF